MAINSHPENKNNSLQLTPRSLKQFLVLPSTHTKNSKTIHYLILQSFAIEVIFVLRPCQDLNRSLSFQLEPNFGHVIYPVN
jgi:hypothetical protein